MLLGAYRGRIGLKCSRITVALAGLALLAAIIATVMFMQVFPHGSLNNDEGAYLLQARTLAHGHLFLSTGPDPAAHQPWFFAIRSGHFVPKYLPGLAALYALSIVVFGGFWPVLVITAAALPIADFALAREVGLSAGESITVAAIVSLSPFVLVQSGLALSYIPFAVAMTALWLLAFQLFRGAGSNWRPVLVGFLIMFCASIRPYDTVLLLLPFIVVFCRRRALRKISLVARISLGAAPLVAFFGYYNWAATGNPLRLPFNLFEPSDAIGFGTRRLFPEDSARKFGVTQAIRGEYHHFLVEPLSWFALGAIVLPAAALYIFFRDSRSGRIALLLQAVIVFLVGYFFFWGPYNASVLWGGPKIIGPLYALVLLTPLAIAAVPVLVRLGLWSRPLLGLLVIAAVSLNGVQLAHALRSDLRNTKRTDTLLAAVKQVPARDLLLVHANPPYTGQPVSALSPLAGLPEQMLAPRLDPANVDPSRSVALVLLDPNFYGPHVHTFFTFEPQRRVSSSGLEITVGRRSSADGVMAVAWGTHVTGCTGPADIQLLATETEPRITCTRASLPASKRHGLLGACPTAQCLDITLYQRHSNGKLGVLSVRRLVIGKRDGRLVAYVDQGALEGSSPFVSITSP